MQNNYIQKFILVSAVLIISGAAIIIYSMQKKTMKLISIRSGKELKS